MPIGSVPERYLDRLHSNALGHLATVGQGGRPRVNPVWFIANPEYVYLSIKPDTGKYRNLRANPSVAMSISDPTRPSRYLEIRGAVVEFQLFDTLAWVNQLARKYTGADFAGGKDGELRYKVTIRIDSWTAQD